MNKRYVRKFLNKKEGTAFVELRANPAFKAEWAEYDAHVKIADCNRIVTLNFDVCLTNYNHTNVKDLKADARDKLEKAKILLNCFSSLVEDLEYINDNIESLITDRN